MSILFLLSDFTSFEMNDELSQKVIGAAFKVHNELGFGFVEAVYERALAIELENAGVPFDVQSPIKVSYRGQIVGEFVCDVLVDKHLIVELKSVKALAIAHEVQLVNYLNATKIDVGLLINFGADKVDVKRKFRKSN